MTWITVQARSRSEFHRWKREALCFALNERVQAVLLDVSWVHDELGGTSQAGIDLLAEIRSVRPELPVLMYSSHDTAALRERCRHLGAGGYLIKGADDDRLIPAVRALASGGSIWPAADGAWEQGNWSARADASNAHLHMSADLALRVLNASPEATVIVDAQGTIRFASRQLGPLFGYGLEQLLGRPVEMLMPERFRPTHVGHRKGFVRHVRARAMGPGLELFGLRSDGTEFPGMPAMPAATPIF